MLVYLNPVTEDLHALPTPKVFRKGQAGRLLEHLAKIERADVHSLRDAIQIDRIPHGGQRCTLAPGEPVAIFSNRAAFGCFSDICPVCK